MKYHHRIEADGSITYLYDDGTEIIFNDWRNNLNIERFPILHYINPKAIIGYHHTEGETDMCLMEEDATKHNWVGSIETNSGIKFNIENPTPEMVDIEDISVALGMICRYNGQIPSFYSVAEHSVRVAEWLIENGHEDLAFAGLMHDSAEAYIGDIVRPMKLIPDFAEIYNEFERLVETAIGEKFDVELWPMHPTVKEADKAVYEWEVQNIRSANQMGWGQFTAISRFEQTFEKLYRAHKISSAVSKVVDNIKSVFKLPDDTPVVEHTDFREEEVEITWDFDKTEVNFELPDTAKKYINTEEIDAIYDYTTLTTQEVEELTKKQEVRVVNEKTGGEKGSKLARFDLVPVYPLTVLAEHYGMGALKYDSNQWRKGYDYSLSYAALQRHLTAWWNGEDNDPEFGDSHLAAVAWHAFALLQFSKDFPELDDRLKDA